MKIYANSSLIPGMGSIGNSGWSRHRSQTTVSREGWLNYNYPIKAAPPYFFCQNAAALYVAKMKPHTGVQTCKSRHIMSPSSLWPHSSLRSLSLSITSFVSVYWLTALKEIAAVAVPLQTVYYTIDNVYPQKLGDCRLLSLGPSRSHRNCIFCWCQTMDSMELNPSWILWILWIL